MKKKLLGLSEREDALVNKNANSDQDALPLTDREWAKVRAKLIRGKGELVGCKAKPTKKKLAIA